MRMHLEEEGMHVKDAQAEKEGSNVTGNAFPDMEPIALECAERGRIERELVHRAARRAPDESVDVKRVQWSLRDWFARSRAQVRPEATQRFLGSAR